MGSSKRVLVVGGGIAGISAAVEASQAGAEVVLIEKQPYLGGRVSQMNLYFPKLCPPSCGLEINFRQLRNNSKITCYTQSEVHSISGEPGNYTVSITRSPRFVTDQCTACGACIPFCPVRRPDPFNYGLSQTRAIYFPSPAAYPPIFTIDPIDCLGEECSQCIAECPNDAVDLKMQPETFEIEIDSVVLATGWRPYPPEKIDNLGYASNPNVITNVELERLAAPDGPTGGQILRPSDQEPIESAAFIQCAGSRDENYLRHCSSVCCLASLKQVRYIRQQYPKAEIYLFYIDLRAPGRMEDFYLEAQQDPLLHLVKGKVGKVYPRNGESRIVVEAENVLTGRRIQQPVDLVILATGMVPQVPRLSGNLAADEHGFLVVENAEESAIFPAGCVRRPVGVAEAVRDATAAAMKAVQVVRG
ncbi:MAG: CoB--CoM heterodisulfide reductase iron-sulfur subunit A family protein [Acidobacteriota bacterium]|nr:MAG: CoB--CoM heterodisulfide reductase iron-sulfur subunit A family protein [Acidobacteriota bacterium]